MRPSEEKRALDALSQACVELAATRDDLKTALARDDEPKGGGPEHDTVHSRVRRLVTNVLAVERACLTTRMMAQSLALRSDTSRAKDSR